MKGDLHVNKLDGKALPKMGQGTWYMGDKAALRQGEIAALRTGVELGMSLIDTAEMYGSGASESLIGEAIRPLKRESLFLVSKVYPHNAGGQKLVRSCEGSLKRLGVDVIDLYLLHWRGSIPLRETMEGMRQLVRDGKIRYWGVSNLDRADMQELLLAGGKDCQADQVLYHLGSRGVEYSLLPWLQKQSMLMMAYCPLAQAGTLRQGLAESEAVRRVAAGRGWSPLQVLLAFSSQPDGVITIPKASDARHTALNAEVMGTRLSQEELTLLNSAFPPPTRETMLDIV